jgi:hypothetical protein
MECYFLWLDVCGPPRTMGGKTSTYIKDGNMHHSIVYIN